MMVKFLAATQRIDNMKRMTIDVLRKCKKIRERGKLICCMNRVRLNILHQMWDNEKTAMIKALSKKAHLNKKLGSKLKKRIGELMSIEPEVKEQSIKAYYLFCKERGAKNFIQWRIEQARLQACYPYFKKALRLRRLVNYEKYNLENVLYRLYRQHEANVKTIMPKLIQIEMQIQRERDVPVRESMY